MQSTYTHPENNINKWIVFCYFKLYNYFKMLFSMKLQSTLDYLGAEYPVCRLTMGVTKYI